MQIIKAQNKNLPLLFKSRNIYIWFILSRYLNFCFSLKFYAWVCYRLLAEIQTSFELKKGRGDQGAFYFAWLSWKQELNSPGLSSLLPTDNAAPHLFPLWSDIRIKSDEKSKRKQQKHFWQVQQNGIDFQKKKKWQFYVCNVGNCRREKCTF